MDNKIEIISVDSTSFEVQDYSPTDENLIIQSELDTQFRKEGDYIEYFIYDENHKLLYPFETTPLTSFTVIQGDVLLNPSKDLVELGFNVNSYFINYNFYRTRLSSNPENKYFISEINSDRTEIRLNSNQISPSDSVKSSIEFIKYRKESQHFVDFKLNLGENKLLIANNIKLDESISNGDILIKLYEPLPSEVKIKTELWVTEIISEPQTYKVTFPDIIPDLDDTTQILGPNFHIDVKNNSADAGQPLSYNDLIDTTLTSSQNQLSSLLGKKGIKINVNYEDFSEFVHFSSAKTRFENFNYKVKLIEEYNNELENIIGSIGGNTTGSSEYNESKETITSEIDEIIRNFDGYDYFMYYDSGSSYSYPKTNTTPPYILQSTGSAEVVNWSTNVAASASLYDDDNKDWLYYQIPEYLLLDNENYPYTLFLDMIGQHFDNIWIYSKDVSNRFNMDNRLEYGISKDLVAEAIRDFGVKLYSNNFNQNDLFTAFLGITDSGSLFPYPNITSTLPAESGYEYVDTLVSSSNDIVPLDDVNKRIYKRIYHNIPYLLKTKGTIAGLRALITSYGIPDTILRINEFGGKDKENIQDWDLGQNKFNYAFDTKGTEFFSSDFQLNP